MAIDLPGFIYHAMLALVVGELICHFSHQSGLAIPLTWVRTLTALGGCIHIIFTAHRLPLYGPFESMALLNLILGGLCLVPAPKTQNIPKASRPLAIYSGGILLVMMLLQIKGPLGLNRDYFMYADPTVILFFHLRVLAAGIFIHGGCRYLAAATMGDKRFFHGGRNALLAGTCIYLGSEWNGSLWCLNWYGDSWHWSRGFFKAAILFLLVMAALHLPPNLIRHKWIRATAGSLPGLFMIWMLFYH